MAAQMEQPPPGQALAPREAGLRLTTSEEAELAVDGSLALGQLDITTEQLSLAGIEKEIEAFGDSEVLRAILDQGAAGGAGGGRRGRALHCPPAALACCACLLVLAANTPPCYLSTCLLLAGVDPKEYSRQYEARLRQAEVESIQDYIAESDSLAALHSQAS